MNSNNIAPTPPAAGRGSLPAALVVLVSGLFFPSSAAQDRPVGAPPAKHLQVALVSGSHSPAYLTDQSLARLKEYLERQFPMNCVLLTTNRADNGFLNLEALDTADTAVFFVRRKTLDAQNLAAIRNFFQSGKGFVALRATSHAWENWPSFDVDVLGAKYEGTFAKNQPMDTITRQPHPIFTGTQAFATRQYMYQFGPLAPDVQVLMQGRNASGTTPMAWTREHKGGRGFYLVPGHADDFQNPAYLRLVANGILWVARREIPGAAAPAP